MNGRPKASMEHPRGFLHWSSDPYFYASRRSAEAPNSRRPLGAYVLLLLGGGQQAHLDRLNGSLGAVRDLELREDVLEVPLDRREGEVQILGYLAVGLAGGEAD